jgi:hypothetical protein
MEDVRKYVDPKIIKESWAYNGGSYMEFQIPSKDFYYYQGDHCLYNTKACAWMEYLNRYHPEALD